MIRSCVLTVPRTLAWQDRPRPSLGPAEVRIRPHFAGICGTDLALWRGDYPVPLPLVLGHEFCGEVIEAGGPDGEPLLGRIVTAEINHHCLARGDAKPCRACRKGLPLHCQRRTVFGIISQDGAFQSETVALARNCHPLPPALAGPMGVFVEPLAAALNAFAARPITPGEFVLVLGAGRLGSLIALVAHKMGADVLAVARREESLRRVAALGVPTLACPTPDDALAVVQERTEGLGADRVVDATSDPATLPLALRLVRPRGIVSLKSTPGLPAPPLDLTKWVVDEITVEGTRCGDFAAAIEFYENNELDLGPLVQKIEKFGDLEAGVFSAQHCGKVILKYQNPD